MIVNAHLELLLVMMSCNKYKGKKILLPFCDSGEFLCSDHMDSSMQDQTSSAASLAGHEWMLARIAHHGGRMTNARMDVIQTALFSKNILRLPELTSLMTVMESPRRLALMIQYLGKKEFKVYRELANVLEEQNLLPELVQDLRREPVDIPREGRLNI